MAQPAAHTQMELALYTGEVIKIKKTHDTFARYYSGEASGAEAYRKSMNSKATPPVATQGAYKLLKRDEVLKAVEHYKYLADQKISLSEGAILCELGAIGMANIADMFNEDSTPKDIKDIPLALQRAIKKFKVKVNIDGSKTWDVEFWNKTDAIKQLSTIKDIGATNKQGNTVIIREKHTKEDESSDK